jgi:hypothetical protein
VKAGKEALLRRRVAVLLGLLWVASGLSRAAAGDCLPVWMATEGQASECGPVHVQDELKQDVKVCCAASREKAVVRVRLTRCVEQVAAAAAPPGASLAGREFIIRAEAREGQAVKELAGHGSDSWAGAVKDLCRAIAVWHGDRKRPQ